MLVIDKTQKDVLNTALTRLKENSNINAYKPGDIAHEFLKIVSEIMGDEDEGFYPMLRLAHLNAFLSTASKDALDMIGILVSCKRRDEESDDDYRYRISKQVLVVANANETAVRLAALSVDNVKEVILKPYTHGTGSFSCYIVTDDPYGEAEVLTQVKANLDKVKAYGIRVEVFKPKIIPVQLKAKIIYKKNVGDAEKPAISAQATEAIRDYINSRYPGEELIVYEIIQKVMEIDSRIYDMEFMEVRVKNRRALIVNQKSKWNERFFEAKVPRAIEVL